MTAARMVVISSVTAAAVWVSLRHIARWLASSWRASRLAASAALATVQGTALNTGDEAHVTSTKNVLLVLPGRFPLEPALLSRIDALAGAFCGTVVSAPLPCTTDVSGKTVYVCGDVAHADASKLHSAKRIFIVRQLATGLDRASVAWPVVDEGRVPALVEGGLAVFYPRFFEAGGSELFHQVSAEHTFQQLTESTKPGCAHRTGLYLTPVREHAGSDEVHFRLLRCSSNFDGPTEGFGPTDDAIVGALNDEADRVFADGRAPLNHVLAQIYHNTPGDGAGGRPTKAKIKAHADKTKDMPQNGLLAFCTFYDGLEKLHPLGHDCSSPLTDLGLRGVSGLSRLVFHRKRDVTALPGCAELPRRFTVTLFPGSVLLVPLSTNRLYQHEVRPGALDAAELPTRMGYVVRCSDAEAVHASGWTYLKTAQGERVPLERPTPEGMRQLRALYAEENACAHVVDYSTRGHIAFSMNEGDYLRPQSRVRVEADAGAPVRLPGGGAAGAPLSAATAAGFHVHSLQGGNHEVTFDALAASARFEDVAKGRRGAVLVLPDGAGGIPIVRTTTKYTKPAQRFAQIHESLARQIEMIAGPSVPPFNNALIECYTNAYAKMGFHSDQALDLADDSSIALYTCYAQPQRANPPPRRLVVEPKSAGSGGAAFEIALAHDSVVVFSAEANRRFRHKIVLGHSQPEENEWLGVTFRTSKTLVRTDCEGGEGGMRFVDDGAPLVLADTAQRAEFYKLRGRENAETGFTYPQRLAYTISPSDLLPLS